MIYLDHAASTFLYPEVADLLCQEIHLHYANPSGVHPPALSAKRRIETAMKHLGQLLGVSPGTLTVCSGATEAINTAIKAPLLWTHARGRDILISAGEHAAVREAAAFAAERAGYRLRVIPLSPAGCVDLAALEDALGPETAYVATIHVNNETGAIQPLQALSALIRRKAPQALWLLDSVQAFCKETFCLSAADPDFLILSGHKIHGPKGVGILYSRPSLHYPPLIHGGGQQDGRRSGSENPWQAVCFARAAELGLQECAAHHARVTELRRLLLERLTELELPYTLNSPAAASPYIVNLSFPGLRGETLLNALGSDGICISTASSCHSRAGYSAVLEAMGLSRERLESAVRLSLDASLSDLEITEAAGAIARWYKKLARRT